MVDRAALSVTYRKTGELVPYARNARTHSAQQIDQIVNSIIEFGFTNPILIDEKKSIIAGHGRVMAAEKMKLGTIPTIMLTGLSQKQKRAYVLADNKLALNAGWDDDLLRLELGELGDLGFDLTLTGFDAGELTDIFATKIGMIEPDDAPEIETAAVSRPGDVWLLGPHRLVCGDSTSAESVALALKGHKPNLMVTDPPYGVEYDANWRNERVRKNGTPIAGRAIGKVENDGEANWSSAFKLFAGDVIYAWHADLRARQAIEGLEESGFEIRAQIIWAKQQFAIGRGHYHFQHEPCWYAVRNGSPGDWHGGRKQSTLWEIDKPQKSETGHSTQKPVECMKRPIENNSKPGDSVYEPFAGSFTTGIAAEISGRICLAIEILAIEISENYVDLGVRRWQAFTACEARLESTGQTFLQVERSRAEKSQKPGQPSRDKRRKAPPDSTERSPHQRSKTREKVSDDERAD